MPCDAEYEESTGAIGDEKDLDLLGMVVDVVRDTSLQKYVHCAHTDEVCRANQGSGSTPNANWHLTLMFNADDVLCVW